MDLELMNDMHTVSFLLKLFLLLSEKCEKELEN